MDNSRVMQDWLATVGNHPPHQARARETIEQSAEPDTLSPTLPHPAAEGRAVRTMRAATARSAPIELAALPAPGVRPRQVAKIVNWRSHSQELVAWREADGHWRLLPLMDEQVYKTDG